MAKGGSRGKSSASSSTRKKQATKAAKKQAYERDEHGNLVNPELAEALEKQKQPGTQRGQKKDKGKGKDGKKGKIEKKKQYVPPPKPPQPLPDPLDSMGLASLLPADLVVLLRKASKKDVITRCRALEGILAWIEDALGKSTTDDHETSELDKEQKQEALVVMLPCWVHLFPRLALSPTRRLRLLTMQIQTLLLQRSSNASDEFSSSTRSELLESPQYVEPMLAPWAILCFDTDRTIERLGRAAWNDTCSWSAPDMNGTEGNVSQLYMLEHLDTLLSHLRTILLSPSPSFALSMTSAHAPIDQAVSQTNSGAATPVATLERDAKNRDDSNVEEDTSALDKRLVAGALSVLTTIVNEHPTPKPTESLQELLSSRLLWSSLSPSDLMQSGKQRKNASASTSFGFDSPHVRVRAWTLLRVVNTHLPSLLGEVLNIAGVVAMTSAWQERDLGVQRSMLDAILPLLKANPTLWLAGESAAHPAQKEASEDEDSSDEYDDDDDEQDDDEGEDTAEDEAAAVTPKQVAETTQPKVVSRSYATFLQWLQSVCGGGPVLGYPAVVVFISTIPAEVLPHDDYAAASDLLDQMFSALYSRALDNDPTACRAFLSSFSECVAFLAIRMYRSSSSDQTHKDAPRLAHTHFSNIWRTLVLNSTSPADAANEDAADEERIQSQRIKNMSSSRIAQELSNHLRRLASVAPNLDLVAPVLTSIEEDLARTTESIVTSSSLDVLSSGRARTQASLERAASLLTSLLRPSAAASQQQSDAQLQTAVSTLIHRTLTLSATFVADIAGDDAQETALRRLRADVLAELMSLLLQTLVSASGRANDTDLQQVDKVASVSIPQLTAARSISASSAALFLSSYLPLCSSADSRAAIWTETLSSVADLNSIADQVDVIAGLLRAIEAMRATKQGSVTQPIELPVPDASAGVEDLLMTMTAALCDVDCPDSRSRTQLREVVTGILAAPKPFVEVPVRDAMLAMVTSTIEQLRNLLLTNSGADRGDEQHKMRAARVLPDLLDCFQKWLQAQPKEVGVQTLLASNRTVVAAISDLALLGPFSQEDIAQKALGIWAHLTEHSPASTQKTVLQESLTSLQGHLVDVHVPVGVIVPAAQRICAQLSEPSALSILPKHTELQSLFDTAVQHHAHPALLVFDPLVTQQEVSEDSPQLPLDAEGLSVFARACLTITLTFEQDRSAARQNAALLPHLVLFSLLIEDDLLFPGASKHSLSTSSAPTKHRSWLQRSIAVSTALVSSLSETVTENWHNDIVMTLQRGQVADQTRDGLGHALSLVWQAPSNDSESSYLARVFHRLLSAAFNFGTLGEPGADRWLKLADSVQDKKPLLAQAVVLAAKGAAELSPTYDRLRNASAAKLAGLGPSTPPNKVLQALRMLIAVAPPQDSDLSLIPQQRAIFLLKDLQKWYSSDESEEEPDEEVNSRLAELFVHLIPIVQDVQGSHFDFMFDLIETNLEFSSLHEASSLPQLYASLRLLETLRDYAARNANLREYWKDCKLASLQLVRDLFLSLATPSQRRDQPSTDSAPRQACAELIVDLIREVPSSSFDMEKTCGPLCKVLIESPSHDVQVISYRLLSISIRDHIKELVVETAVNKDASNTEEFQARMKLPEALVANVSDSLGSQLELLVEEEAARKTALGYFMSWIAIFDHFENASLAVKSAYVADLEKRELLPISLLPSVFALVGLAEQDRRLFDPSRFAVDEVFLDQIDVASSLTVLQVIAAHVYLRALIHVPTMVRSWWVDIKDRQLSMQIANFTIRHCSPVIASRELSHLREPEALSRLQDEALTIKILSTNEVIATYVVDEHPMEIGVKIPADFPLHGVEIRDIQRVGITEAKWRSWLLAVQQLITGQNGLIFDALSLFKRNAEVQFQGLEECAICYSIISPMDRSLPSKPCKTCKNKFHSGCLFKWISTSGSSTCPLCRSIL